jgi:hypothetical protein
MDTKERKTRSPKIGSKDRSKDTGPAPMPDPIRHPARRSRGEKRLRKTKNDFKRGTRKFLQSVGPQEQLFALRNDAAVALDHQCERRAARGPRPRGRSGVRMQLDGVRGSDLVASHSDRISLLPAALGRDAAT